MTSAARVPALADISSDGYGSTPDIDRPTVQIAWVAGVCVIVALGSLVVTRFVRTARMRIVVFSAALIVLTYPLVWAFGYQDHPWHFHLTANLLAILATIAATILFVLGERTDPSVSKGWTGTALFVTLSSIGAARFWDEIWSPGSDVIGNNVLIFPIAWMGCAVFAVSVVIARARWNSDSGIDDRHG